MHLSKVVKKTIIICLFFVSGLNVNSQTCNYLTSLEDSCNLYGAGNFIGTAVDANICFNKQWNVVFEDNFDGTSIDYTEKWRHHLGDGNGLTNKSLDYHLLDENIEVSNGTAKFITKQESIEAHALTYCQNGSSDIDNCVQGDGIKNKRTFNFTSGALWTKQGTTFNIGKIEIRCKLPNIDGLWPAFWLYNVGQCYQEIDVFEFNNYDYNESSSISNKQAYMTYHRHIDCPAQGGCHSPGQSWASTKQTYVSCTDYTQDFHTFSVEWDAYQITRRIDGAIARVIYGLINELGQTVDECNLSSNATYLWNPRMPLGVNPMYMSVGVGVKNFDTALNPKSRGTYPAVMEVDYVRAYKRVPISEVSIPNCTTGSLDDITISNTNFSGTSEKHIKNSITTSGTVKIESGANVWWTAQSTTLEPGFKTEPGAHIVIEAIDCNELFGRLASQDTSGSGKGKTKGNKTDTTQIAGNVQASVNEETKNQSAVNSRQSAIVSWKSGENATQSNNQTIKQSNNQAIKQSPITITPNPSADGKFNLNCTMKDVGCMEAEISVMNALGQTITKEPMNRYPFPISIDLSSQPRGTYFVKIQNAERVFVEKVVSQ